MLRRKFRAFVIVASALIVGASPVSAAAPTISANAYGTIGGGGATFPLAQYTKWFSTFTRINSEVRPITTGKSLAQFSSSDATNSLVLSYAGSSSGTGISNFYGATRRASAQMFSGSDSVLTSANRTSIEGTDISTNYTVIPATAGPISIGYNLPGLKLKTGAAAATIRLDGETLCGIYSGQIQKWNDDKLKAINPTVALPDADITVVGRSNTSGTTFIFASYLGRAATAAQKMCGYHSSFVSNSTDNFDGAAGTFKPVNTQPGTYFGAMRTALGANAIVGQSSNQYIAEYIRDNANTIGYVETSYIASTRIKDAAIAARSTTGGASATKVYLKPTAATVTAALTNAVTGEDPINPTTAFVQPVYAAGTNSYPIVGYSWWLIYTRYTDATVRKGQVEGMIAFMNWALTTGQSTTNLADGFTPLPAAVRTAAINELHRIQWNGAVVWP